ncbi:MAG: hypothetical protein IJC52_00450, partial [Clostridia bacterium]|nr:hypothetical protein [Clostridia bacterium]
YTIQTVKKSGTVKAGSTFTVNVTTNKISKICMVEFFFAYDATKVQAVSGTAKGFLADFAYKKVNVDPIEPKHADPDVGEVWITGMDLNDDSAASGEVIATITFKALKDLTTDVSLYSFQTPLAAYAPVNPLTAEAVNGGIKMPVVAQITAESSTASYAEKDKIASAKVTAVGDGRTYTWYVKNPGATKYSKSSITSATYQTKMTEANSDRRVYCIVKDQYGNEVRSKTFVLRMKATITSVPATAAYAAIGQKVSVAIGAAGDELTYAWYIKNANGTKYSKSSLTGPTYTTAINSTSKGRRVYCVVTDKYGKTAQTKTFILRESVSIVTQPQSVYGAEGTKVSTTVEASGDGLTYTWYVRNVGETKYTKSSLSGPTYTTKMTDASKDRLLSCKVVDQYGNEVRAKTVQLKMK